MYQIFIHYKKQVDEPMKFKVAVDPAGRAPELVLSYSPEITDE